MPVCWGMSVSLHKGIYIMAGVKQVVVLCLVERKKGSLV